MAKRQLPSPEDLRQLLRYEPETGKLFWKERDEKWFVACRHTPRAQAITWNKRFSGKEALAAVNSSGYRTGTIFGIMVQSHRIAWAIHYGEWPTGWLDHINGTRTDNRITNLREATGSQNGSNRGVQKDSISGIKGVRWHRRINRWQARITVQRKQMHLGYFTTSDEAAAAYAEAAAKHHGEFARLA